MKEDNIAVCEKSTAWRCPLMAAPMQRAGSAGRDSSMTAVWGFFFRQHVKTNGDVMRKARRWHRGGGKNAWRIGRGHKQNGVK